METPTTAHRGPVQDGPETAPLAGEGSQPTEICGVPVDAILRLGKAASDTCALPYPYGKVARGIQRILPYTGLIETVASQPNLTEAVEEHLPKIKKVAGNFKTGLTTIDRIASHVPPLRRRLDARVTREILGKALELQTEAGEKLPQIETEVAFLSSFENPRQELQQEITTLTGRVGAATMRARENRVAAEARGAQAPAPRGIFGTVVLVIREVKSFFGRLFGFGRRNNTPEQDVTAYDVGQGFATVISELRSPVQAPLEHLPLIRRYVSPHLAQASNLSPDKLALAAPELLNLLYSLTPENPFGQQFKSSVERHPHELRFVTQFKRTFGRYDLDRIQSASQNLLPALRDVLPETGAQVLNSYNQLQKLLAMPITGPAPKPEVESEDDEPKTESSPRQPIRTVLRRLFGPAPADIEPQASPQAPSTLSQLREILRSTKPPRQPWRTVAQRLLGRRV
jgi:hypothetical protein